MKTQYPDLINQLVSNLEFALDTDLSVPENRDYCSSNMFGAYYSMSSLEEKEFTTWIMNTGSDLDLDPLEKGHPREVEEVEEYKNRLRKTISYLRAYLPDEEHKK